MARKRNRRARRSKAAPLLIGLLILVAVVFALRPYNAFAPRPQPVSVVTPPPAASVSPMPASPSPSAQPNASGVRVAIIIDDCGQWIKTEREYVALPIPLTLSVLPHLRYTQQIAQEAADAGKGVMLHLPMEPASGTNAGPGEITIAMNDAAVDSQTEDDIAQVPLAKGMNNHEGSAASADSRIMRDVIAVAKEHNLYFIDSRTSKKTVAAQVAAAAGVPSASRNVFLDNQADVAYTESMLERTLEIARRNGSAIAIGHPKPTTLAALQAMYPKMQAAGVIFVLASDLVR